MELTKLLRDLANAGVKVQFEQDWGENTLTISLEATKPIFMYGSSDKHGALCEMLSSKHTHTHLGYPGCTEQELHDGLVRFLGVVLVKAQRG